MAAARPRRYRFRPLNSNYEKASIALTSNRDRSEWPELFGEALLASAALDRLTHGAHFVTLKGDSYRLRGKPRTESPEPAEPAAQGG